MILGMNVLTFVHVVISLVAIVAGLVVAYGLLTARRLEFWTALFLITTVITSVTGFLFPIERITPGLVLGGLSLIVLALAITAKYYHHLAGRWRVIYVVTAIVALYFNVFVLVAQLYQKVPALNALAPTQSEPPFLVTQLAVLVLFVLLTAAAIVRSRALPGYAGAAMPLARHGV